MIEASEINHIFEDININEELRTQLGDRLIWSDTFMFCASASKRATAALCTASCSLRSSRSMLLCLNSLMRSSKLEANAPSSNAFIFKLAYVDNVDNLYLGVRVCLWYEDEQVLDF